MVGIVHHDTENERFKDVIQRLSIRGCTFHGYHLTTVFLEPVSHCKKISGCSTKIMNLMLVAFPQACNNELLVYINTTTNVVNLIHTDTFWMCLRHGTMYVIILLYVLLLQAVGQIVVQMRVQKSV